MALTGGSERLMRLVYILVSYLVCFSLDEDQRGVEEIRFTGLQVSE